ncbi:formimidoylglutamate deiminase, partial [Xanthomonas oryzae pv. oryzae]
RWLYDQAGIGAAQALGVAHTGIRPGAAADLVELDAAHPALLARNDDALVDSWLFAARGSAVRNVWRGGRWVVRDGRHADRARIATRFAAVLRSLLDT